MWHSDSDSEWMTEDRCFDMYNEGWSDCNMEMRWLVWRSPAEAAALLVGCHHSEISDCKSTTEEEQSVITLLFASSRSSLRGHGLFTSGEQKKGNRMSGDETCDGVTTEDDEAGRTTGFRWGGHVLTDGPWVELCVQNLQRMHQVPLWAGRGLCWICWTLHFLFFFVLHLRIDVEAWDLPWGKIHSEATHRQEDRERKA